MYQECHVVYTIITIIIAWYFNQSLMCPILLTVHTGADTSDEPIRT